MAKHVKIYKMAIISAPANSKEKVITSNNTLYPTFLHAKIMWLKSCKRCDNFDDTNFALLKNLKNVGYRVLPSSHRTNLFCFFVFCYFLFLLYSSRVSTRTYFLLFLLIASAWLTFNLIFTFLS
uniref:Uncharacterized protein n=1 Tax=Cacopsylla melanoneura TaxID=428564 RepID=A0A8D9A8B7_9HEMI